MKTTELKLFYHPKDRLRLTMDDDRSYPTVRPVWAAAQEQQLPAGKQPAHIEWEGELVFPRSCVNRLAPSIAP